VPPKDARSIAGAVLDLAGDRARAAAMGASARRFVAPDFSLESMVMRIEALYEELVREKQLDRRR
jgi:glycosyltransferase involved in cell wall biosynthesis